MPQLVWLEQHMHHSDTLAEWLYRQFHYEFVHQSLAQWQQEFAAGQSNGECQALIALDHGQLLGSAALMRNDLPQRPDLGPWLACVFVTPQARGRGIAESLIESLCEHARSTGASRLYLHTQERRDYYLKRGWSVVEPFAAWGNTQWLMSRTL